VTGPNECGRIGREVLNAVENGLGYFEQACHFLRKDGSVHHLYDYTVLRRNE